MITKTSVKQRFLMVLVLCSRSNRCYVNQFSSYANYFHIAKICVIHLLFNLNGKKIFYAINYKHLKYDIFDLNVF